MRFGPNPVLVDIRRRATDADFVRGAYASVATLMGSLRQVTGQQKAEAGMVENAIDLFVRFSVTAVTRQISIEDRLIIDGLNYAVKSVALPERRGGFIEIGCILSIGT